MFDFIPYLSFLTSGIGLFFIFYLIVRFGNVKKVYGLVFIIFALVYLEFYIYALTSKHIYKMLFVLRTPNILRAFLPISLFFYVRGMLIPNRSSRPIQYLHWLFPVAVLIGIMPDLLLSAPEKTAILDAYYAHNNSFISTPSGWIPAGFVQPVSIMVGIGYGLWSLGMIAQAKKNFGDRFVYVNRQTLIWLNLLSGALSLYFLLQLYQYINLFLNHTFDPPSQIIKCIVGIGLFAYFISTPNVLENMDGCILKDQETQLSVDGIMPNLLVSFTQDAAAILLDQLIKSQQTYLNPDCDLTNMAKSLNMSSVKLSKSIKSYYGLAFTEFVNRLRINYFLDQRSNFSQFTMETYIYQSGFTNRSTFYAAFKKHVGVNPSFYLKEMKSRQ
jgi:AraC-like DNA-binding protein